MKKKRITIKDQIEIDQELLEKERIIKKENFKLSLNKQLSKYKNKINLLRKKGKTVNKKKVRIKINDELNTVYSVCDRVCSELETLHDKIIYYDYKEFISLEEASYIISFYKALKKETGREDRE